MIGELAGAQWGVVERGQLRAAGVTRHQIERRLAAGLLVAIHRGVYAVGHRVLVADGFRLAAVLACGPDAALSHRSAGGAWGLRPSHRARHEVTTRGRGREHPGIDVHRCRLTEDDVTDRDGIRITTPSRTLLDLAEVVGFEQLRNAVERTHHLRLLDLDAIDAVLARAPGRRGRRRLLRAVELFRPEHADAASRLETAALRLIERHRLKRPSVNVPVGPYVIDLLWPRQRLAVELDSRAHHLTPQHFESDRRRDADLLAAGYRTLRFTWRHVHDDPEWVVARLRAALAHESREGGSNP